MQTEAIRTPGTDPHHDLLAYRPEFPILQSKTFLNTCSLGALSQRSIAGVGPLMLALEVYRRAHAEVGRGVVGAHPRIIVYEPGGAGVLALPAPAYDQRLKERLALGAGIQETCTLRRAHPLVAVPRVEVGPM